VKVHLKGLNGIRAIAAISVVCSHIGLSLSEFGFKENWDSYLASYGVSMFFSLSGFLITYLLLLEKERYSKINIKNFYIRRILRIWPLYYFYLLLAVVALLYFSRADLTNAIYYYIFLCANVPFALGFPIATLTHYWSLGVEEQFYLVWPWVARKSGHLLKWLLIALGIFIAIKLFTRYIYSTTSYQWPYLVMHNFRFDCMMIGAMGAILYFKKNATFFRICFALPVQVIAWLSILLMALNKFHIASVTDSELVAIITVVLITNLSGNQKTVIDLERPFFDFLGKISYGIYVYHPLIIFLVIKTMAPYIISFSPAMRMIILFTMIPASTVLVAYLSYELFEKRLLRLKTKYSFVHTQDTAESTAPGMPVITPAVGS